MLPDINALQANLLRDSDAFMPELLLCAAIVGLLVLRLVPALDKSHLGVIALVLTAGPFLVACCQWQGVQGFQTPEVLAAEMLGAPYKGAPIYGGPLVYDPLTPFLRPFLL